MKITHIYKTCFSESVGGVEQFIRQLTQQHTAAGHHVTVLTLAKGIRTTEQRQEEGATIWRFPLDIEIASNGFSLSEFLHIRRLAGQADILHYHFPWPTGDLLHQLVPGHIPALVTYHSDIVRQRFLKLLYTPLMKYFLAQMRCIVATSPNYVATSPVLQNYPDKTRVVPIGLDASLYPKPADALLAEWRLKVGDNFFLFVGLMRYYKGLHTLIEAALKTGLPVVIAGSGPIESWLREKAGNAHNIHFVGQVSDADKMALLTLCRAFVFPSHQRSEAFGISLLEAAMCSKPMISCEIGTGTTYINQTRITGLVVPPEDSTAFAAAMQQLAEDDTLCTTLGAAAYARYRALFTAQHMADAYLHIYQELVAG